MATKRLSLYLSSLILCSFASTSIQDNQFLQRVKAYWKEGDYATAKKQISFFLDQKPDSELKEELHLLLGDLYLQEGCFQKALDAYSLVQKKQLKETLFYNEALCLYELKQTNTLLDLCKRLPEQKGLSSEQLASIYYLSALSLFEVAKQDPSKIEETLTLFKSCKGSSLETATLYPIAKLHELQGDQQKALESYLELAEKDPVKAPDLLFQVAMIQSSTDVASAIRTFQKVISYSSSKQSEALYNCLLLQYQMKDYQGFIDTYQKHQEALATSHRATPDYLMGKSLYHLHQYEQACPFLLTSIKLETFPKDSLKTAKMLLLECAYQTKEADLFKEVFKSLEVAPSLEMQYVYLDLLKTCGKDPDFIEEARLFLAQNPSLAERETVLWDLAHSLYQVDRWSEADETIDALLRQNPLTSLANDLYQMKLHCALKLLQTASSEQLSVRRDHLIKALEQSLDCSTDLSSQKQEPYLFELARNLFIQKQFVRALETITRLTNTFPDTSFAKEVEQMETLCYLQDPTNQKLFVEKAEDLLQKQPDLAMNAALHKHLFNAYLELSEGSGLSEKKQLASKAAEHLYAAFEHKEQPIHVNNLEWLADHYLSLSKGQEQKDLFQKRAQLLFEELLSEKDLGSEKEAAGLYKLCELFSTLGEQEKKKHLLESWAQKQTSSSPSFIEKKLLFELAKTYANLETPQKALELYETLIRYNPSSHLSSEAILERSKLLFSQLSEEEKKEDNITYQKILDDLKDLELRKDLLSEPLHLEAGLEYIRCKSALAKDPQAHQKKTLHLLEIFKETAMQTALKAKQEASLDYELQDQCSLILSYTNFIEAEILRLKAALEGEQSLKEQAKAKITELLDSASTPPLLKQRAEESNRELTR